MKTYDVPTFSQEEIKDITSMIQEAVSISEVREGICCVYVPHTTAGLTINENADPDVKSDILMTLKDIVSNRLPFRHGEGNSPAHVKASLMGSAVTVPIHNGKLALGTWQGICFCEFDGPRRRHLHLQIINGKATI